MTREEQIQQAAEALEIKVISNPWTLFQKGAKWADSHPAWVSVKERMPEENEEVLAYNAENEEVIACDYHHKMFHCWPEAFNESITHWMPLPTPPVKKGGEE